MEICPLTLHSWKGESPSEEGRVKVERQEKIQWPSQESREVERPRARWSWSFQWIVNEIICSVKIYDSREGWGLQDVEEGLDRLL